MPESEVAILPITSGRDSSMPSTQNPRVDLITPAFITDIRSRHLLAVHQPQHFLSRGKECGFENADISLDFDETRGDMPVLRSSSSLVSEQPLYILANLGGQLMNSPIYPLRHDPDNLRVIEDFNISAAPTMLVYSRPGDIFVSTSEAPEETIYTLQTINRSFKDIGIELASDFSIVGSIDDWIEDHAGRVDVLPNILEPELLRPYISADNSQLARRLLLANVAAYTKHGPQQLWELLGVPTPETKYYHTWQTDRDVLHSEIADTFSRFDRVVMNRVDGSGGYGIVFSSLEDVRQYLATEELANQHIQVQGEYPITVSPCTIANISPREISLLTISQQIFHEPGAHAGNMWSRQFDYAQVAPDFFNINVRALEALQRAGVVGQVNVDSLVLSAADARRYNTQTTLMREANIRPAGSSIINRLKRGTINNKSIDRVLTSTKIPMPSTVFYSGHALDALNFFAGDNTRAVLYNYNRRTQLASVAFVGTAGVTEQDLLNMKKQTSVLMVDHTQEKAQMKVDYHKRQSAINTLRTNTELLSENAAIQGETIRSMVPWHIFTNDIDYGKIIPQMAEVLKNQETPDGKLRVSLLAGTGGILSISPEISKGVDVILVFDYNRFVPESIANAASVMQEEATIEGFRERFHESDIVQEILKTGKNPYEWEQVEREALDGYHFQSSQERYELSREALAKIPIVYVIGNFLEPTFVNALTEILQGSNGVITHAHMTDSADWNQGFTGELAKLPFHAQAAITWSTNQNRPDERPVARLSVGIDQYVKDAAASYQPTTYHLTYEQQK